jgi:hypothetical protein
VSVLPPLLLLLLAVLLVLVLVLVLLVGSLLHAACPLPPFTAAAAARGPSPGG